MPETSWMTRLFVGGAGRSIPRGVRGCPLIAFLGLAGLLLPMSLAAGTVEVNAAAAHSGSYGLEVTLAACTPATLTIEPPPVSISGEFTGCTTLSAQGVQVLSPGATFKAGSRIILADGFSVAVGASLNTLILESLTGPWAFVQDNSPAGLTSYRATFDLDAHNLSLAPDDLVDHLTGHAADGTLLFRVSIQRSPTLPENHLVLAIRLNDGSYVETAWGEHQLLPGGSVELSLDWHADAGTGHLLIGVDVPAIFGLSGLDNNGMQLDYVRWGAVSGSVTTGSGSLLLDNFRSYR